MAAATGAIAPRGPVLAVLAVACTAQFMATLDSSIMTVALPHVQDGLGFSPVALQWAINAYTVPFVGFMLLGGRAADLLGRRRVLVIGLLVFGLASLVGGLAESQGMLIAARAVQGLGAAVMAPASLSILTTAYAEGARRNRAVGYWAAAGGMGGVTGVLLGGVLTDLLSWRWVMFINVPIALAAAALALATIAESRSRHAPGFDLAGAVTATLGLSALVLGIVRAESISWGSGVTVATIGIGLALLAAFVVIEQRFARAPLVPLRIFRARTLRTANLAVFCAGASTYGMWFFVSLYLQEVLGLSPLVAGLAFLPMNLSFALSSAFTPRLVGRFGPKVPLVAGTLLQVAGLLLFTRVAVDGSYWTEILVPSVLVTIGSGLALVPSALVGTSGVRPAEAGLASALINTARLAGGTLGLAVLVTIAAARTGAVGGDPAAALTSGYQLAFGVAAGFAALGTVLAVGGLPRMRPGSAAPGTSAPSER